MSYTDRSPSQLGAVDHFDVGAHLPQGFRAVVAAAHHVADLQVARDLTSKTSTFVVAAR